MKKTIILMLLAVAAFSFTACDSLIPNDLPTEEENTQGGNGNEGNGESVNNEDEPWITSDRLLKSIEATDENRSDIEYDDKGRMEKLIYTDYQDNSYSCEYSFEYKENSMTITMTYTEDNYSISQDFYWGNGYLTDFSIDSPYVEKFQYLDGYLIRLYEDKGIQETDNVWENGNLIKGSTLNMDYSGEYTYLDKEDKVNVSFYGGAIIPKFKGHTSKNYISIVRTKYVITYFEYTFDSEGYPTTMTETQISDNDSHLSQYIFTYYE